MLVGCMVVLPLTARARRRRTRCFTRSTPHRPKFLIIGSLGHEPTPHPPSLFQAGSALRTWPAGRKGKAKRVSSSHIGAEFVCRPVFSPYPRAESAELHASACHLQRVRRVKVHSVFTLPRRKATSSQHTYCLYTTLHVKLANTLLARTIRLHARDRQELLPHCKP